MKITFAVAAAVALLPLTAAAQICNLKLVTDASPDYSDMNSMVHSITSRWETPEEKCWALFYWNHIARRQTSPMHLRGVDLTDPIMQYNDYGFTMCSTVSGINTATWDVMGLPVRYWEIGNHTVCEVQYNNLWHMYDSSLSAIYTLCDGKTIAGAKDIGAKGACPLSNGKEEQGHIAKYHCLNGSSLNGYLTGADCARTLESEAISFHPNNLKEQYFYKCAEYGHRYILNLRPGETYTRYYHRLDADTLPTLHDAFLQPLISSKETNPRWLADLTTYRDEILAPLLRCPPTVSPDDGILANYARFGGAVKKMVGK